MKRRIFILILTCLVSSCMKDTQFQDFTSQAKSTINILPEAQLNIDINGEGEIEKTLISISDRKYKYVLNSIPKDGWNFVEWNYENKVSYTPTLTITIEKETDLRVDFVNVQSNFSFKKETIIELPNQIIWGLDFKKEDLIFTTKGGDIFLFKNQILKNLQNPIRNNINSRGQGGLLDIKFHPNFDENQLVYILYTELITDSNFSKLVLANFNLKNDQISNIQTVFKTNSLSSRSGHFGSRIAFSEDHMFISIGEGSPSVGGTNTPYKNAQNLNNDWGKIHRLYHDGSIPPDNPFTETSIFSIGHRNPQGLVYNPYSKNLISTEHGPQGGDEINLVEAGENYGWPLVSYGINYDGSDISGKSHSGFKEPIYYWDPSIAISQIILLKNTNHNNWFGSYLVCGLRSNAIHRIGYSEDKFVEFERIHIGERVRSVTNGKAGEFYISTDSGKIIKFSPSN